MSAKHISLIIYCWVIVPVTKGEIGIDYMFDDVALRMPQKRDCDSQDLIKYCAVLCGTSHACVLGKCDCLELPQKESELQPKKKAVQNEETFSDYDLYTVLTPMLHQKISPKGDLDKSVLRSKPALRHHIAHFCPNLEEARTCIRGCMKFGKPAFCGKDHVCYCGHKYDNSDDDQEVNIGDVHEQFRDLYLKYFGPEQYRKK